MSNFAKEQLLKYGWTEGKGLGKNEDGIPQAIKAALKFDNAGIGYKETPTEHWWQARFDDAAKNIKVKSHEDQVSLSVIDNQTTLEKSEKNNPYEKYFSKPTILNKTSSDNFLPQSHCETSAKCKKNVDTDLSNVPLTDEQLYLACGGRTAHKTARHALTLGGKLERIAQQDGILLGASNSITCTSSTSSTSRIFNTSSTSKCNTDKELRTCSLKKDDAEPKPMSLRHLKNKRKIDQDVIKINPDETEDIYFFRKRPRMTLNPSAKKLLGKGKVDKNKKSFNELTAQIARGFRRMSIKQESGNVCYETKKTSMDEQLKEQNVSRDAFNMKCLRFAHTWSKVSKMKTKKPMEFLLIKRLLEVNKHMDLLKNIEKCMTENPYVESLFQDFYFMMIGNQLDVVKQKRVKRYRKMCKMNTQSNLASHSKRNR